MGYIAAVAGVFSAATFVRGPVGGVLICFALACCATQKIDEAIDLVKKSGKYARFDRRVGGFVDIDSRQRRSFRIGAVNRVAQVLVLSGSIPVVDGLVGWPITRLIEGVLS
jgi:hypothetical protein